MTQRLLSFDTIAAIATANGEGGIAIVRISGENAYKCLKEAFRPAGKGDFSGRRMVFGHVLAKDGSVIDECMAVFMKAPKTYTREDVAEIHCHGGRIASGLVLRRMLECGSRLAEAGEFTKRAFLNGRIDLARAEGIMRLISAGSESSARSAIRQMEGGASGFVKREIERLTGAISVIEAATDFPDEIEEQDILPDVEKIVEQSLQNLLKASDARSARMVREGVSVALVGRTNAGKSSLLNALLGQERAIVTDIPGTTRDVLTASLDIEGIRLEISDTAGQRETDDMVEAIGVSRAKKAQEEADVVVLVLDGSEELSFEDETLLSRADERTIVVSNKQDIAPSVPKENVLSISAKTGEGIEKLLSEIVKKSGAIAAQDQHLTSVRHIETAKRAAECLKSALEAICAGLPADIVSGDIMASLSHLTGITGENASEKVIDRVFRDFCVGK
ncbi:MAG: tRNA uridine-5-carboxymethylaminomethyl(34) synthesis GTPase MnmE [Christensenellales bacterium]|jgi:tRNA modification GTPase